MSTGREPDPALQRPVPDGSRVMAAHCTMAATLARTLLGRVPPGRTARLYAAALSLKPEDGRWLRRCVLRDVPDTQDRGLLRFHAWMRLHSAPWGDPALAATLEVEFARCRRIASLVESRSGKLATPHVILPVPRRVSRPSSALRNAAAAGRRGATTAVGA